MNKTISSYDLGEIKSTAEFLVQLSKWERECELAHWERNVIGRVREKALKRIVERASFWNALTPDEVGDLPF